MRFNQLSLSNFDMFVPDLKLNLAGKPGVGTRLGAFVTFAFFGIFAAMAALIVMDFLDTSKPRVSQGVYQTSLPPKISFTQDKLFPMLAFRYQIFTPLKKPDLDRFVTVDFTKIEMSLDESGAVKTTMTALKTASCSELVAQGKLKTIEVSTDEEREVILNGGICVDVGDADVSLGRQNKQEPFYQQVLWRVFPCSLDSGCASLAELSKVSFSSITPKPLLDLSDHGRPVRHVSLAEEINFMSASISSKVTLNLLKTELLNEAGFLQAEKLVQSYTSVESTSYTATERNPNQLTCSAGQIATRVCVPFWVQNMITGPRKMVIKRQYKGMVETFSELGGMVDMLFMLFFLPYSVYNNRVLKDSLVELVHGKKKPQKPAGQSARLAGSPDAQADYGRQLASFKQLRSSVEEVLDIAKIASELKTLRGLIASHRSDQESQPGAEAVARVQDASDDPRERDAAAQGLDCSQAQVRAKIEHRRPSIAGSRSKKVSPAKFGRIPQNAPLTGTQLIGPTGSPQKALAGEAVRDLQLSDRVSRRPA